MGEKAAFNFTGTVPRNGSWYFDRLFKDPFTGVFFSAGVAKLVARSGIKIQWS